MRALSLLLLASCAPSLLPPPQRASLAFGDDMVVPTGRLAGEASFGRYEGPLVVVLDTDGGPVHPGGWSIDNAQTDTSFIVLADGELPPMDAAAFGLGDTEMVDLLIEGLEELFYGANVAVRTTPPESGPYTSVRIGGTAAAIGRVDLPAGIAPYDADNANPNDVVFVFTETLAAYGYAPEFVAHVVAHEVGHSLGLAHIDAPAMVMNPSACHCEAPWGIGPVTPPTGTEQDSEGLLTLVAGAAPTLLGTPVDLASTVEGYWVLDDEGGVHAFGVEDHGHVAGIDAVSLTPTLSGQGYWVAEAAGTIHAFGDAEAVSPVEHLIVDLETAPAGLWAMSAEGQITALAGATDHGSVGAWLSSIPTVALVGSTDGYWIATEPGYVWSMSATWHGSYGSDGGVVDAMSAGSAHIGLYADGSTQSKGDAPAFEGELREGVVAGALDPDGGGWVLRDDGSIEARQGALWLGEPRPLRLGW